MHTLNENIIKSLENTTEMSMIFWKGAGCHVSIIWLPAPLNPRGLQLLSLVYDWASINWTDQTCTQGGGGRIFFATTQKCNKANKPKVTKSPFTPSLPPARIFNPCASMQLCSIPGVPGWGLILDVEPRRPKLKRFPSKTIPSNECRRRYFLWDSTRRRLWCDLLD